MERINLQEIARVFKRQGLMEDFEEQSPLLVWSEICSPQMGRLTQPVRVRQGVMYIETASHVVAQQLQLLKESYIKKINQMLGETKIKDLRFRVGSGGPRRPAAMPDELTGPGDLLEQEDLKQLLDTVEDPNMRAVFERLVKTNLRWDRIRSRMKTDDQDYIPCSICGLYHEGPGSVCYYCDLERGRA